MKLWEPEQVNEEEKNWCMCKNEVKTRRRREEVG